MTPLSTHPKAATTTTTTTTTTVYAGHGFPKNEDQRVKWIKACRRQNWAPSNASSLCTAHFSEDQVDRTSVSLTRLRKNAVPNIFPAFPSYLKDSVRMKRKPPKERVSNTLKLGSAGIHKMSAAKDDPNNPEEPPLCINMSSVVHSVVLPEPSVLSVSAGILKMSATEDDPNTAEEPSLLINKSTVVNGDLLPGPSMLSTELGSLSKLAEEEHSKPSVDSLLPIKYLPTNEESLKRKIGCYEELIRGYRKKIKTLHQQNRRYKRRIEKLSSMFQELKDKHLCTTDSLDILSKASGVNEEFLKRQLNKVVGSSLPKTYSSKLRTFALTLHFYSPRAYSYVRETFDTCLPYPRTISSWYRRMDAEPGFTDESFKVLAHKVQANPSLKFSLVYDEMCIKKHVEFDGKRFHGFVEIGCEIDNDSLPLAKEALVFIVVSINENWKLPVGYFLLDGITSSEKANLITQCLRMLHDEKVNIVSMTFDGLSANLCALSELGCSFSPDNLITKFPHPENPDLFISVLLDPCHMLKCVRNTLGHKGSIVDGNNNFVEWKYIKYLHELQESEGLCLANKLRDAHVKYYKQKMKVKLASQTLSKSVADALHVCKDVVKDPKFQGCEPTIKFITMFNDVFDIMNSQSMKQFGFKKPLSESNYESVLARLSQIENYICTLKVSPNGERIVDSNRRTGFIGFLVNVQSLRYLFHSLVMHQKTLMYIPVYKLSQDHVEIFFQCIRSLGGCSNNPTAKQFKTAYKKLLFKCEVKCVNSGNCIPLQQLSILSMTHAAVAPEKIINVTSKNNRIFEEEEEEEFQFQSNFDHDYLLDPGSLTLFTEHVVYYVGGFVVHKLLKTSKCENCIGALCSPFPLFGRSLITYKTLGGLIHPSVNVYNICKTSEKVFRRNAHSNVRLFIKKKLNILQAEMQVIKMLMSENLFSELYEHTLDQGVLDNHIALLIRAIVKNYLSLRFSYWGKNIVKKGDSVRNKYTKLILFKGQ